MAALAELLGAKLLGKGGEVDTATALTGKTAVALYFSGHWCPPCRGFTPQLAGWYTSDLQAKGLEVVFVSSDKDEGQFTEYYGEQPWLALPFSDREKKDQLSKKFKVQGIPSVVVLGPDGELITTDGRSAMSKDTKGLNMPLGWKPKTFKDIFDDVPLVGPGGTKKTGKDLMGTVFGLYFSAHWCPPCRGFTPQLAEWYNTSLKEKGLEVVFVSGDNSEEEFKSYFAEQPWLALEYGSTSDQRNQLNELFGIRGIPSFVIIDKDGSIISKEGKGAVSGDPTGKDFPWHPKPVSNLKGGPGDINEVTTVLAFCETQDEAGQKAIETAMEPLAKKFKAEAKAKGEESPEIAFLIVTENAGLAPRLRSMMKLAALPPKKHEHPLEKSSGTLWCCDGCSQSGEGKDRYRCTAGCDYDLCGECHAKAAETGGAVYMPPQLMILDIPDNGAYFEGPVEVTTETVQKLVDDYTSKTLKRQQLG